MTQIPILMKAEMVRASLEDRKGQTRRTRGLKEINENPDEWVFLRRDPDTGLYLFAHTGQLGVRSIRCPYGNKGDILVVRETFVLESTREYHEEELRPTDRPYKECGDEHQGHYFLIPHYRATEPEPHIVPYDREDGHDDTTSWKPSIHMPWWACRLHLENTEDPRLERLQDISEADAVAEGCDYVNITNTQTGDTTRVYAPRVGFWHLWDSINGAGAWDRNPLLWVVTYKRLKEEVNDGQSNPFHSTDYQGV